MNNLFINWWQEEINEVNNIHITLNRLSEAGRTGGEELGEWIPFAGLFKAQRITKGQPPLSHFCSLLTAVTSFLICPARTADLQRCPESTVWFLHVFGDGGKPCGDSCSGFPLASAVMAQARHCLLWHMAAGAGAPLSLPLAWNLSCNWETCWALLVYSE